MSLTPRSATLFRRASPVGYFAAPILLALVLYWPGLTAWFQKDDFAWLGLRGLVQSWHDFWWALFAPLAQGTVRTLSERVFFMSFTSIFGMHALPFRCCAFLTFAATLPLLSSVCTKLTGSRAAGFWAMILWTVNSGLAVALSWTSNYYELLCAFIFLAGFWLLLRYLETGEQRFYVAQWLIFALGFGVLELNVVYPALAAVYALCCARRVFWKVVPMFALSAVYTAMHFAVAPLPAAGPYKTYWDSSMIPTLSTYWKWALGPSRLILFNIHPSLFRSSLTLFLSLGLAGFLAWKLYRKQWVAAFFPAWFLITLSPFLPLRDHIDDSYLTVPVTGLAMWGGWALVSAWRAGQAGRVAAVSLLAIYVCVSVPVTRSITVYLHDQSQRIRKLVLGVAGLSRTQPEKIVLLKNVDTEMFWSAVYDRPFGLFGAGEVYLAPEDRESVAREPQLGAAPSQFYADPVIARNALGQNRALVLDVSGENIRDITAQYKSAANIQERETIASRVDLGNDFLSGQLGPTWYPNEGGFRWMPKRATVTLHGPRAPTEKLYITGACPAAALKSGPLKMQVGIDGEPLAPVWIRQPEDRFSYTFELPRRLSGRSTVEVTVELNHTFVAPSDSRELGLAFSVFEIR